MATNLAVWRVIATRPLEQNTPWCGLLQQQGFEVLNLPLLSIVPVTAKPQILALRHIIQNIDCVDSVIFVSQNAVHHGFRWLQEFWPQLPIGIQFFAVGTKTAKCIEQYLSAWGAAAERSIITAGQMAMNSEELLSLPQLQSLDLQKILICRGEGGRPKLEQVLVARGAKVQLCELYRREFPPTAAMTLSQASIEVGSDIMTVFSGETLTNLVRALSRCSDEQKQKIKQLPLIVPGERVAEQARALGFVSLGIAQNASEPKMLEAVLNGISHGFFETLS